MLAGSASWVSKQFTLPVENAARGAVGQGLPPNNEHKKMERLWAGPASQTFGSDCDNPSAGERNLQFGPMSHMKLSEIPFSQPQSFPISHCQAGGVETEQHAETGSMAAGSFPPPGEFLTGHLQAQFNPLHQLKNEVW